VTKLATAIFAPDTSRKLAKPLEALGVPLLNIVFDLGGVVFNWQPHKIIERVFEESKTQNLVRAEIFEHADWIELDRGTLTLDQAIVRGAARTGLPNADIERLFGEVPRSLTPNHGTIELISSVIDTDNKFFVLSNMHVASFAYLEKKHDIWSMFDGVVISSQIRKVKPEIEIYEHLLSEYNLEAAETVFIDDMSENLAAASSIGIQTVKFVSPSQCKQDLTELKYI
jgi:putative hydrolase of the HAD superfamily